MVPPSRSTLRWNLLSEEEEGALFSSEELAHHHRGKGAYRGTEFLEVRARSVINTVPGASRMPFRYTVNVYRGCSHACTYCFARPTHAYLNLDIARDFETKIVVKVNAIERVAAELASGRFVDEHIAMGTNTDPYQKAEAKYHLTRGVIGELVRAGNPFSILTKSTLVLRDLDLLAGAARSGKVRLNFSIGTLDRDVSRLTEPGTPPPDQRVEAVRRLNEAGIPCGVLIAPVLPGLSDHEDQIAQVAEACAKAGAVSVSGLALHLRQGVREHYLAWLKETRPDLVALYEQRFARRAYQGPEVQEAIREAVSRGLRRAGTKRPRAPRLVEVAPKPVPPVPLAERAVPVQLHF